MNQDASELFPTPDAEPISPWEAISAFIKSIRLRYPAEALLWLVYLWQHPKERSRLQRRILLCSGEDNLSVEVIEKVAAWHAGPRRTSLDAAATEVLRICGTANWWAQPDGREYIYAWRRTEKLAREYKGIETPVLIKAMESAIQTKQLTHGLAAFNALYARKGFNSAGFAGHLLDWAAKYGGDQAKRLAGVYSQHNATIWLDGNISGQAYYALIHGNFGEQSDPEVSPDEVSAMLSQAAKSLQGGVAVPSWTLDGVHTRSGSDKRFAGVIKSMCGCCRAYEHFGRLSPEDVWLPSFMSIPEEGKAMS